MKKPRRSVSSDKRLAVNKSGPDHGTPERWQHGTRRFEETDRAGTLAARVREEHLLDVLCLCRQISVMQKDVAFRLKADYQRARLSPLLVGRYDVVRLAVVARGVGEDLSENQEAAYRRWRGAMEFMGYPYADVVTTVVCHDLMPRSQDLRVLSDGLAMLVGFYGLSDEEETVQTTQKTQNFAEETKCRRLC